MAGRAQEVRLQHDSSMCNSPLMLEAHRGNDTQAPVGQSNGQCRCRPRHVPRFPGRLLVHAARHASWTSQAESHFRILARKLLTPAASRVKEDIIERLIAMWCAGVGTQGRSVGGSRARSSCDALLSCKRQHHDPLRPYDAEHYSGRPGRKGHHPHGGGKPPGHQEAERLLAGLRPKTSCLRSGSGQGVRGQRRSAAQSVFNPVP